MFDCVCSISGDIPAPTPAEDAARVGRLVTAALIGALDTAGKADNPEVTRALKEARRLGWLKEESHG